MIQQMFKSTAIENNFQSKYKNVVICILKH